MKEHLYLENGEINPKLLQKPIIIYGCGNDGMRLIDKVERLGGTIEVLCDSDPEKWGNFIKGYEVIAPQDLGAHRGNHLALAFYKWPEVIDNLNGWTDSCYVDYPFFEPVDGKCMICGSNSLKRSKAHWAPFIVERMFGGLNKTTNFLECSSCNIAFSEYRPNEDEMSALYTNYRDDDYISVRTKYEKKYLDEEYNKKYRENERKSFIEQFLKNYLDIKIVKCLLDYGGDEGQFIPDGFVNAEKYVYDISGIKLRDGVTRISKLNDMHCHHWDFIMCCHVLEHVSDPLVILDILVRALDDGGYLYIELPFEDFMYSYHDIEINEHINFYRTETLKRIAQIFKLNICCIKKYKVTLVALYQKRECEEEQIKGA